MNRRAYLSTVTGLAAATAGCGNLGGSGAEAGDDEDESDEPPKQVQVARRYFLAIDDADAEAVNRLLHEESPLGTVSSDQLSPYEGNISLSVGEGELIEKTEDEARVEVQIEFKRDGESGTNESTQVVELRKQDGKWRIWRTRVKDERTPTESTPDGQVTNRVTVVSAVGTDIESGTVGQVSLTVKRAPGAGNVDLSQMVLQWVSNDGAFDLLYESEQGFRVEPIKDDDGSLSGEPPVLNDEADRATLVIDVEAFISGGLSGGESVSVQITTQSGGTTNLTLTVPESLSGREAIQL